MANTAPAFNRLHSVTDIHEFRSLFSSSANAGTPIILSDQDGVLFDWQLGFDQRLVRDIPHVTPLTREELTIFKAQNLYDAAHQPTIQEFMDEPGFYSGLEIMEGAVVGLNEIAEEFPTFIVTAPYLSNRTCASEKLESIRYHFGDKWLDKTILSSDKTLVRGSVLIDDKKDITGSVIPTWEHVAFAHKYNEGHPLRMENWANWEAPVTQALINWSNQSVNA